mmetsp:Transcript_128613/g.227730  ORF Transcript_128613/g.227730 Transcript_128613/m.227730 type:complete len:103 (-) Transcript_128613:14-322(-)
MSEQITRPPRPSDPKEKIDERNEQARSILSMPVYAQASLERLESRGWSQRKRKRKIYELNVELDVEFRTHELNKFMRVVFPRVSVSGKFMPWASSMLLCIHV